MKKEFMLYIRNSGDAKSKLSEKEHSNFINQCEIYIEKLKAQGSLISAQPLIREGSVITRKGSDWNSTPVDPHKEIQVGYYHILAKDINEAITIAKNNPEFEYVPSASIEVRPVKGKEEDTNYVYPGGA